MTMTQKNKKWTIDNDSHNNKVDNSGEEDSAMATMTMLQSTMTTQRQQWRRNDNADDGTATMIDNKSQYWPRGAPKHAETAENEKA